jgi:hypothetical protein
MCTPTGWTTARVQVSSEAGCRPLQHAHLLLSGEVAPVWRGSR